MSLAANQTLERLRKNLPDPEALRLIPEAMARKYSAIPVALDGNTLVVAMANPADIFALEALATYSHLRIEAEAVDARTLQEAIDANYRNYGENQKQLSGISESGTMLPEALKTDLATDAPVAQALTLIVDEAVKARASDIHLQPEEDRLRVRYRIDGILHDTFFLPLTVAVPVISRIKILAKMNIADHQRPQDGQLSVKSKGRTIDIRVGMVATVNGEMATLRLLDKSRANLNLTDLGLLAEGLEKCDRKLKFPYGIILVSGPTGAGKTTTLYAAINSLDRVSRNIITVEDPVEYRFKGINQIQVNPRAGLTFASGLRSILRLDPNVILIGEIRDAETAGIAIQSALTGHLVMSSIHANDAAGVITRLLDLGIERFLVSSAIIAVIAQRMVRRLCPECARLIDVPPIERLTYSRTMGEERRRFKYGAGCNACSGTGYRGRTGLFEILTVSEEIRSLVLKGATNAQIHHQAVKEGMVTLMQDGMRKVKAGITTPAEVMRHAYATE